MSARPSMQQALKTAHKKYSINKFRGNAIFARPVIFNGF